jgi:hypothetical protein
VLGGRRAIWFPAAQADNNIYLREPRGTCPSASAYVCPQEDGTARRIAAEEEVSRGRRSFVEIASTVSTVYVAVRAGTFLCVEPCILVARKKREPLGRHTVTFGIDVLWSARVGAGPSCCDGCCEPILMTNEQHLQPVVQLIFRCEPAERGVAGRRPNRGLLCFQVE